MREYNGRQANIGDPSTVCGSGPCDPSNSRIRDSVSYLETQLSELHGLMSSLESRIETVTTPVPPTPCATGASVGKDSSGPISHLLDRLQCLSGQVNDVAMRLRSLTARVEV